MVVRGSGARARAGASLALVLGHAPRRSARLQDPRQRPRSCALRAARRLRQSRLPGARAAARQHRDAGARALVRLSACEGPKAARIISSSALTQVIAMAAPKFPETPEFTGLNTPIVAEYELTSLKEEGKLPAEASGTFV